MDYNGTAKHLCTPFEVRSEYDIMEEELFLCRRISRNWLNSSKGKKVAFIGAGVSHKTLIKEFVELGAHVTLCDQKKESVEDFGDYACHHQGAGH